MFQVERVVKKVIQKRNAPGTSKRIILSEGEYAGIIQSILYNMYINKFTPTIEVLYN